MIERVACLNCMDGRTQLPVIEWIRTNYNVEFIDMITEPGMDGFLVNDEACHQDLVRKINISIKNNQAQKIFVVGHYDCRGNPAPEEVHREQILEGTKKIKNDFPSMGVVGMWVNSDWQVEKLIEV